MMLIPIPSGFYYMNQRCNDRSSCLEGEWQNVRSCVKSLPSVLLFTGFNRFRKAESVQWMISKLLLSSNIIPLTKCRVKLIDGVKCCICLSILLSGTYLQWLLFQIVETNMFTLLRQLFDRWEFVFLPEIQIITSKNKILFRTYDIIITRRTN